MYGSLPNKSEQKLPCKVLLAHTKKPPFETRIRDKIGESIIRVFSKCQILIAGNTIPAISRKHNNLIKELSLFQSNAKYPAFWQDQLRFLDLLLRYQPDTLLIASPELLLGAGIYKSIFKCRLILDIQENYELNFKYQRPYTKISSVMNRWAFKILKLIFFRMTDYFLLAEEVYKEQIKLPEWKSAVVENKVPEFWKKGMNAFNKPNGESDFLLFSGFLTEESGVLTAIQLYEVLQIHIPKLKMKVAGYCPDPNLRKNLYDLRNKLPGLELSGIDQWITSDFVLELILHCLCVLAPYRESEANKGKVPTKFYEAGFCEKPVVIQKRSQFSEILSKKRILHFEMDFLNPDPEQFKRFMENQKSKPKPQANNSGFEFAPDALIQILISSSESSWPLGF